ncbi:cytochrome P450 [Choiromyces venosus 120613-1]|uniref:Cytochrome P450 n=1 Tax=Choiromyces venosus 120613-1 TaxID=1336337 RepID=A0A3N4KAM6_9PEZI|nr:cytochrome P450 [Choiromyces venosus 120613-1]
MNAFHVLTCGFNRALWPYLPQWAYFKIFWRDWCHHTKFELFEKYGDVICAVSPGGVTIYVGSVEVVRQMYERRSDFPKVTKVYEYVRFYGDNVLTLEGVEWRRHNKYTRPPFNEAVHKVVWEEGVKQAHTALNVWSRKNSCVKVGRDLRTISMNVLSLSNFGVALPFDYESETTEHFGQKNIPPGHRMSYGNAVNHVLDNIIALVITPKWLLRNGPESLKKTGQSYEELGLYLKELIQNHGKAGSSDRKNLLRSLVKASTGDGLGKGSGLTDTEVIGNAFIFAVAGLETTTGTLHYAVMYLALNPDVQDWLYKDLQEALKDEDQDPSKWEYEKVYPKMASVLCVIHETLRLNAPHMHIPKWTADKYQPVNWKGKQCLIPPGASTYITITALHYNPFLWGDTVKEFQPQRWDLRSSVGWVHTDPRTGIKAPTTPSETPWTETQSAPYCHLRTPVKGAFAPFSDGWRACVGKNFALVEMTAVLATLFRGCSVRIKRQEGETQEMADNRGKSAISNSESYLTIMIRHDVELEWVRR